MFSQRRTDIPDLLETQKEQVRTEERQKAQVAIKNMVQRLTSAKLSVPENEVMLTAGQDLDANFSLDYPGFETESE